MKQNVLTAPYMCFHTSARTHAGVSSVTLSDEVVDVSRHKHTCLHTKKNLCVLCDVVNIWEQSKSIVRRMEW